jgi:hypothetical protein
MGAPEPTRSTGTIGWADGFGMPHQRGYRDLSSATSSSRRVTMATAEEVRDALFERIAYHAISADTDEVLTLAKAYSLLVDDDADDEEDEDDDE